MLHVKNIEKMEQAIQDRIKDIFKMREAFGLRNELYIVQNKDDFNAVKLRNGVFITSTNYEALGEDINCSSFYVENWWLCRQDGDAYIISVLEELGSEDEAYDKIWCKYAENLNDTFLVKEDGSIIKKRVPIDINRTILINYISGLALNRANSVDVVADWLFFNYLLTGDYEKNIAYGHSNGYLYNQLILDKNKSLLEKWLGEKSNYEPWMEHLVLIGMYENLDSTDKLTVRLMLENSKHWKMFKQAQLLED